MQLGEIQPGLIRTIRYLRAANMQRNSLGKMCITQESRGGITMLFELDYVANEVTFTAALTRSDDQFVRSEGRDEVIKRAMTGDLVYSYPMTAGITTGGLVEDLYNNLHQSYLNGELNDANPKVQFLRAIYKRIHKINLHNTEVMKNYDAFVEMFAVDAVSGMFKDAAFTQAGAEELQCCGGCGDRHCH